MIKQGQIVFGCEVLETLTANDAFESYRVESSEFGPAKLLVVNAVDQLATRSGHAFVELANGLAACDYPHVGLPLKAGEADGALFCLYDLPSGIPIVEFVNSGPELREVLRLIIGIAESLKRPHDAGDFHGNLSAGTVFLQDDGLPRLADFSLSRLVRLGFDSGIDPHFSSPEQVRGEDATVASDIYSLGCLFFYLLTGKKPFRGDSSFSVATLHLEGAFPQLPDELASCQDFLASLVRLTPGQRPDAAGVADEAGRLLADPRTAAIVCGAVAGDDAENVPDRVEAEHDDEAKFGEMSARIEERLKEYSIADTDISPGEATGEKVAEEKPEQHPPSHGSGRSKKVKWGSLFMALAVGMLLGATLHFLLPAPPQEASPASAAVDYADVAQKPSPDAALREALRRWQEGDVAASRQALQKVIDDFPEDPRGYNNLAAVYASDGQYDQARNYLEKALATDRIYLTIQQNLGAVYAEMARDSYGKALQLKAERAKLPLQVFAEDNIYFLQRHDDQDRSEEVRLAALENHETVEADQIQNDAGEASSPIQAQPEEQPEQQAVKQSGTTEDSDSDPSATSEQQMAEAEKVSQIDGASNGTAALSGVASKAENYEKRAEVSPQDPKDFLREWAQAWSSQAVDRYLSYYGEDFDPAGSRTLAEWREQRRRRLSNPEEIIVDLEQFRVLEEREDGLLLEVVQHYRSDRYSDVTRKHFELQRVGQSWAILSERSVERIR